MNYDKIKRTGILFLLGIGAITSLSCNDNDNANYPERVPTRLSVMPLPERVDYKESVVSLPQNVTVSQHSGFHVATVEIHPGRETFSYRQ